MPKRGRHGASLIKQTRKCPILIMHPLQPDGRICKKQARHGSITGEDMIQFPKEITLRALDAILLSPLTDRLLAL